MKKLEISILVLSICCAILLIFGKIAVDTLFASGGVEYSQVETQTQDLQKENIVLKEKILAQSSYFTIASEAATMGFIQETKNSRIVLTNPAVPIAYNR